MIVIIVVSLLMIIGPWPSAAPCCCHSSSVGGVDERAASIRKASARAGHTLFRDFKDTVFTFLRISLRCFDDCLV